MGLRQRLANVAFDLGFAFSTLVVMVTFYRQAVCASLLLLAVALLGLLYWRSWSTLGVFLFMMFFGSFVDVLGTHAGIWHYDMPDLLGIPAWLVVAWGNGSVFIYQFGREIAGPLGDGAG